MHLSCPCLDFVGLQVSIVNCACSNFYRCELCSPGPDVQFAPVDDAGELEENGEPAPHPHTVFGCYIHVVTGVVFEGLTQGEKKGPSLEPWGHFLSSACTRWGCNCCNKPRHH